MKRSSGKDIERCKEVYLENSKKGNMTLSSSSNSSSSSHSESEVDIVYPDLDGNDISVTCRAATAPEINYFFEDDEKCEEEKQP